jgi:hypothetical protein
MDLEEIKTFAKKAPEDIQELIDGVTNSFEYAGVTNGEAVLLITETSTDTRVTKAFTEVGKFYGCEIGVIIMDPVWPPKEAPWMVTNAMRGADVAFGLVAYPSIWRHPGAIEAMKLCGCRYISMATMCSYETLASDACKWPMEIYWKIVEKMESLAKGIKKVRVTNPRGTDITADFDLLYAKLGVSKGAMQRGTMSIFPVGDSRMYPTVPDYETFQPTPCGNGTIVFDGFYQYGLLKEPIRMEVENGWVTKIEGGQEADDLSHYLSQYENSLHFNEISWGHNPRMPLQLWDKMLIQANRASSVVHLGVGDSLMDGGTICSKVKPAGSILFKPNLFLDDQQVVLDGRLLLLDDPEVVDVAARYGDAERWLTELEVYEG